MYLIVMVRILRGFLRLPKRRLRRGDAPRSFLFIALKYLALNDIKIKTGTEKTKGPGI